MKQPNQILWEIINNQKTVRTSRLEKIFIAHLKIAKNKDLKRLEQIKKLEKRVRDQRRMINNLKR